MMKVDVFDRQACKCTSNDSFGENVTEISLTLPLNCCIASFCAYDAGMGRRGPRWPRWPANIDTTLCKEVENRELVIRHVLARMYAARN
jgi:hypothetical protein